MTSNTTEKPDDRPAVNDIDSSDVENNNQDTQAPKEDDVQYPKGLALAAIMSAVWLSLFLVALVSSRIEQPLDDKKLGRFNLIKLWS
jgi:hypothetical protein